MWLLYRLNLPKYLSTKFLIYLSLIFNNLFSTFSNMYNILFDYVLRMTNNFQKPQTNNLSWNSTKHTFGHTYIINMHIMKILTKLTPKYLPQSHCQTKVTLSMMSPAITSSPFSRLPLLVLIASVVMP